jgi:hypothetical protein
MNHHSQLITSEPTVGHRSRINLFPPMSKNQDTICNGFSRMLTQEFLTLRRRAAYEDDEVSSRTLEIIIAGITDLTHAVGEQTSQGDKPRKFTRFAFELFSQLARNPNDPIQLRTAGTHYLVEWDLPGAALSHFRRAHELRPLDKTLPILIEIATLAVARKQEGGGVSAKFAHFLKAQPRSKKVQE